MKRLFNKNGQYMGNNAFKRNQTLANTIDAQINNHFRTRDEVVWSLINNIQERPKCKVCGSDVSFKDVKTGYVSFCCQSCVTIGTTHQRQETMLKKYGVKHALQSNEIKTRMYADNLKRYGVEHTFQVDEFKQKSISAKQQKLLPVFTNRAAEFQEFLRSIETGLIIKINEPSSSRLAGSDGCLHFWDYEIDEKFDIVRSIVTAKAGKTFRVFARKTVIKEVTSREATDFFNRTHLNGSAGASHYYGLYSGENLVACASFRKTRFGTSQQMELIRFSSELNTTVVGGLSKLVKHFCTKHECNELVSFADKRISHVCYNAYLSMGFELVSHSAPNHFYVKAGRRIPRYQTMKHLLPKLLGDGFNPSLSESVNMKNNGWVKCFDCGNLKFIFRRS